MQRVTHLPGTLWFSLKSRRSLFGLWDTSRPVKPHLIGLCRLLTLLVQAMLTSQGSFLSAKGWCWHSCFCLAVCDLWHSHPDLYFGGLQLEGTVAYHPQQQLGCWDNTQDPQSILPYATLFCMRREEKCNQFCRTFLLCCQEMPAGFSPLDKIRIEWFGQHYWFDNEFPYFSTTLFLFLCEHWHSAWLTLTSHGGDCHFIRVHTGWL